MTKIFCLLLVLGLIALTQQRYFDQGYKSNKRSADNDTRNYGIGSTGKRSADNRDSYGNRKRFADTARPTGNSLEAQIARG